jgi:uncharacterized iron-regulated membrane protein
VNILLIPALIGLVGFLVYYKKNQSKAAGKGKAAGKSKAAGKAKPEKTKSLGSKRPAKAAKAAKAEKVAKAESESPTPARPRAQRQTANAGGRMGSVL